VTIQPTRLLIRLTPGPLRPKLGASTLNEFRGGPETLLRWMEIQLGLDSIENHRASCVTEYAAALDLVTDSVISKSMANDRWATASELLSRRDDLMLSGWDQSDCDGLSPAVGAMARSASRRSFAFPSISDRLEKVAGALEDGQRLPPHTCILVDSVDNWPKRWQPVLSQLNLKNPDEAPPAAREGTVLRAAQNFFRGEQAADSMLDSSLRYVKTLSQTAAVEFVSATLAHKREQLERTVVLCENDHLAVQLDACLLRYGLPTMGSAVCSPAHPHLQVLPLSLALCWQPVDPQCLLDFLTLPVGPIPRRVATALSNAVAIEPGLGSSEWQACFEEVCSAENDPEGEIRERLDEWLLCTRVTRNGRISTALVKERCASVSKWAIGLASAMEAGETPQLSLIHALRVAAGQASLLGELAESQGGELSQPQLSRLLDEAISAGVETGGAIEAAGGPVRVRSLAEIIDPCYRVIWLGVGTMEASGCRWSADELQSFHKLGIDVDDGSKSLRARRTAEARGLCLVEDSLLVISLPQDMEQRLHPVWLSIRTVLERDSVERPLVLENLIDSDGVALLEPYTFTTELTDVVPPQPARPIWAVDPPLLKDRDTVSATELEDRLACPLKWLFRYGARLRRSAIAQLPDDYRLKGSFCHKILEYAFGDGGALPPVDEAVARVEQLFDERLELDAAPLAQSSKYRERQSLRRELAHAARVLISTLASGGYRIKGIEVEVQGEAFCKPLAGSIDCLVVRADGSEGVIDFKYGGRKYEELIKDGKAVQLATYAYSRAEETGRFPAVAYLVLASGALITPSAEPLFGDGNRNLVDGPGIRDVWDRFRAALENAEEWLTTTGQVPARPLQASELWPVDADMVLKSSLPKGEVQSVCKYCEYQDLCGQRCLT
jgi:ATP-dependent helicase/nuclease subunit B